MVCSSNEFQLHLSSPVLRLGLPFVMDFVLPLCLCSYGVIKLGYYGCPVCALLGYTKDESHQGVKKKMVVPVGYSYRNHQLGSIP